MRAKRNPITTVVDGQKFTKDKKSGYYISSKPINGGKKILLHRYVWQKHNGEIPKGYIVHHIDEDKENNDISNLMLMSLSEHSSKHTRERIEADPDKYAQDFVERTNEKSKEWHRSKEGKKWHAKHGKVLVDARKASKILIQKCEHCGNEYTVSEMDASRSKFCSKKCKAANRRALHLDDVPRECVICGKTFMTDKYGTAKTCSKDCKSIYLSRQRKGKKKSEWGKQ